MSLPEVLLVLREDQRREANKALLALQTEALCAFAVWDKEAGRRLERLRKSLGSALNPEEPVSMEKLSAVFTDWGAKAVDTDPQPITTH